jgi:hypothetical protein
MGIRFLLGCRRQAKYVPVLAVLAPPGLLAVMGMPWVADRAGR